MSNESTSQNQNVGRGYLLSNKVYRLLTLLVQIIIPALSALYFSLADIWGLPNAVQIVGTLAIVSTFLGALLRIGAKSYDSSESKFDGDLLVSVNNETGNKLFMFELNGDPEELQDRQTISFKVKETNTL